MIEIRFESASDRAAAYDAENGREIGYCTFEREEDTAEWVVTHTVVDPEYGGQGIAGRLFQVIVEEARSIGVKIIPVCSYAKRQFEKKPEYADVLSPNSAEF